MKRTRLFAAIVGSIGLSTLAGTALADDADCAWQQPHQDSYASDYGYYGQGTYGYSHSYAPDYGYYGQGTYGYSHSYAPDYGYYGQRTYGYSRPFYGTPSYPQPQYTQPYSPYYGAGSDYGYQGYGTGVVHEDHIRTRFNPFPLPHFDKRVVHHKHRVGYPY